MTSSLVPYVTIAFQAHSVTPTVSIVSSIISSIIGGVFKLTLAKILDVLGRLQGYLLSVVSLTMSCNTVETYAAAQVVYSIA